MTVLALAQACAKRLQIASPSSFVSSTDNNMILLKAVMEQAVQELRDEYPWPELQREYTFTLATSTANYALPGDINSVQCETLWNRTQHWPLIGPIDAVDWQLLKSGAIANFPRQRFRVKGWQTNQFYIDPTPDSTLNGQTIAYEYISKTCIRPKTWVASTSWAGLQYCSYNGNIYDRGGTGAATTGTSAPVNTSGSQSDGSITWTYVSTAFDTLNNDNDEAILDNAVVIDETVWRFKRERGLDYQDQAAQSRTRIDGMKAALTAAGVLTIQRWRYGVYPIGYANYPIMDFGL